MKWQKALEQLIGSASKDLVSQGYKKSDVDEYLAFIKERINYWKGKEKEQGIKTPYY
jgi:hypothetical protein